MNKRLEHWQQAYQWLCRRRQRAPANADVWEVRFHWAEPGPALLATVVAGLYCLSAMQVFHDSGRSWVRWSTEDASVLKWGALQIDGQLPQHDICRGCDRRQFVAPRGQ